MNSRSHAEVLTDDSFDEKSDLRHLSPGDRRQLERLRPEWMRIDVAVRLFGLSRSRLYQLIQERQIRSFALRQRGRRKGIRLISFDSLSDYLAREASVQLDQEVTHSK